MWNNLEQRSCPAKVLPLAHHFCPCEDRGFSIGVSFSLIIIQFLFICFISLESLMSLCVVSQFSRQLRIIWAVRDKSWLVVMGSFLPIYFLDTDIYRLCIFDFVRIERVILHEVGRGELEIGKTTNLILGCGVFGKTVVMAV